MARRAFGDCGVAPERADRYPRHAGRRTDAGRPRETSTSATRPNRRRHGRTSRPAPRRRSGATARQPGQRHDSGARSSRRRTHPGVTRRRGDVGALAGHLGLRPTDLAGLELVRDFTSRSTGIRHLLFRQTADGFPVFDSTLGLHFQRNGRLLRVTSNAASLAGRIAAPSLNAAAAQEEAGRHAPGIASTATLAWLPVDGGLRLAWHMIVADGPLSVRDVLVDAHTGELLLRRNRARDALAVGRVLQSSETAAATPRQPDPMPRGAGAACPPPANYDLRSLGAPFRDPATIVANTGRLEGNNSRVFRGNGGLAAQGTPGVDGWLFDFPFNSAASAETALFFASNFVHDFFYDLGFDEAAGNFQVRTTSRAAGWRRSACSSTPAPRAATTPPTCTPPKARARRSTCSCGTAPAAGPRTSTATAGRPRRRLRSSTSSCTSSITASASA